MTHADRRDPRPPAASPASAPSAPKRARSRKPRDIAALDRAGLDTLVAELKQQRFRTAQLVRWLHQRGVGSFQEMTDLPASLREALAESWVIGRPVLAERLDSADGTRKYLWRSPDGVTFESVGMPSGARRADEAPARLTVCFSTQAGCAMGCEFCATGRGGLVRNLTSGEMVAQVRGVAEDFGARATNAVAMGQGEPFAVYDATLAAMRLLNDPDGLGIGARHLTVSTCGLVPAIRRFAGEPEQFTLAVSLHSAVQATRDRLMPGVRKFPLTMLRETLIGYARGTGRRPTLEYALIAGVNDTSAELDALVAFCRGMLVHVNIIPVNEVAGTGLARSDDARVRVFRDTLMDAGVETSVRVERGADIRAACGQLSGVSAAVEDD